MSGNTFKFFNVPDKVAVEYPVAGIGKVSQFTVLCNIFLLFCGYVVYKAHLPMFFSTPIYVIIIISGMTITRLIINLHSKDTERPLPDVTQGLVLYDNIKHDRIATYDHIFNNPRDVHKTPQRFYCFASITHECLCNKKTQQQLKKKGA